ncbi:signal recognition particle-docking protein FtsY [bacterium]|nr:signal recognition particle-docking protein FtsY [candidate division CSSED10-310 bacterium]
MKFFSGLKARKLSKAIESYPLVFKNYQELITLYISEKNHIDAAKCIELARQQTWKDTELAWLNVQSLRLQSAQPDNSTAVFESALNVLGNPAVEADLRVEAAEAAAKLVKYGRIALTAEQLSHLINEMSSLSDVIGHRESFITVSWAISDLEAITGQPAAALQRMENMINLVSELRFRQAGTIFRRTAELVKLAGQPAEKIKGWLIRAIESGHLSDEETIQALAEIAEIQYKANDLLGAMERYETALRFTGHRDSADSAGIRFQLAKIYYELGRVPQAEKEASLAVKGAQLSGDRQADILVWLADLKTNQDQFGSAESYLEKAFQVAGEPGKKIKILRRRAKIQGNRGIFVEAIETLNTALQMDPDNPDPELLFELAELYNREGSHHKTLKIIKQLSQSQDFSPRIDRTLLLLETARANLGQLKLIKALETLLEIVESGEENGPGIQEARKQLISIKSRLRTPDELKIYKLDGTDRKILTGLLDRIPEEDDFFTRLRNGLRKTRSGLVMGIERILSGHQTINEDVLDEIEELMILSDLGVETTRIIIDGLREKLARKELHDAEIVRNYIRSEIERILAGHTAQLVRDKSVRPWIIMIVGVNGVGKTTTIAKIARRYREEGCSVLLAAGDTFRAGAIEQLKEWGRRLEVDVIAHDEGADPSAVAWDAVAAAKSRDADILIIDTAGRLHTKTNLMEELKKVQRVIGKNMTGAPHEILLVLDATTGQNAVLQAREFCQTVDVSGICLTKLDGTAKGGIIVSVVQELNIPIKLIGIGERMDDLRDFVAESFSRALFDDVNQIAETAETI